MVEDPAVRKARLYAWLLGLVPAPDDRTLLRACAAVALAEVEAETAYLALFSSKGPMEPVWHVLERAAGPVASLDEAGVSRAIVGDVLAIGQTLRVDSAQGHPSYRARHSVCDYQIRSVICAPLGPQGTGVLYVHGRPFGTFSREHAAWIERLATLVAPAAQRLRAELLGEPLEGEEPAPVPAPSLDPEPEPVSDPGTPSWLRPVPPDAIVSWDDAKWIMQRHYLVWALRAHDGNRAATARAISLARARLFALVKQYRIR